MIMRIFVISALLASAAFGQAAVSQPAFEVGSFKKGSCEQRPVEDAKGDHFILRNMPMLIFVALAYDVPNDRVQGPAWLTVECYDLVAKLSPGATRETLNASLAGLLAERVKFKAHGDESPTPVSALVVGKETLKLRESEPEGHVQQKCNVEGRNLTCECHHMTLEQLAQQFPRWMSRDYFDLPVVDLTGLTATYDFTLTFSLEGGRPGSEAAETGGVPLFDAVRDQLGVRIERRKAPIFRVVVDQIEKMPSGN